MLKRIDEHLDVTCNTPPATRESPSRESISSESPTPAPLGDVTGATPGVDFPTSEAITRKVLDPPKSSPLLWDPNSVDLPASGPAQALPLANGAFTAGQKQLLTRRLLIPAAVVVAVTTVAIGLWKRGQGPVARPPLSAQVPASAASPAKSINMPDPPPSTVPIPVTAPSHETIRLEIQVEPPEAKLTLDERMVAENRLRAEVPKDRTIHVVRASAPGFIPFSQIVSFTNDVRLNVELRRARTPVQRGAKPHPRQIESESKTDQKSMPQPNQGEEPGMNMERPALRRASKQIDERDPYTP